ncbi:MAG: DNA cytosine methyltransferase [Mogibacterium sp.]|nr:DNA cytosine methyltransferase [Mogibacterium sp.]
MNKPEVIDLFCGCGGLSLGFKMGGFSIIAGIDNNKAAINTFKNNFKSSKAICADILEIDERFINEKIGNIKGVDLIIGGPPCQGFSNANKNYVEEDDPRNKLLTHMSDYISFSNLSGTIN